MHITEKIQADLEGWLKKTLEGMVESDPGILSSYVLALLESNLSVLELKELCVESLLDFLDDPTKTRGFVNSLFVEIDRLNATTAKRKVGDNEKDDKQAVDGHDPIDDEPPTKRVRHSKLAPEEDEIRKKNWERERSSQHVSGPDSDSTLIVRRRLCRNFMDTGFCRHGESCTFAHGQEMLNTTVHRKWPNQNQNPKNSQHYQQSRLPFEEYPRSHSSHSHSSHSHFPRSRSRSHSHSYEDKNRQFSRPIYPAGNDNDTIQVVNTSAFDESGLQDEKNSPLEDLNSQKKDTVKANEELDNGEKNLDSIGEEKIEYTPNRFENALYVSKIPVGLNTMENLSSHFKTFGTVDNIQVNRDSNSAIVRFSSHDEAVKALKCPEAVLKNRFISLNWVKSGGAGSSKPGASGSKKRKTSNVEDNYTKKRTLVNSEALEQSKEKRQEHLKDLKEQQFDFTQKQISLAKQMIDMLSTKTFSNPQEKEDLIKRCFVVYRKIQSQMKKEESNLLMQKLKAGGARMPTTSKPAKTVKTPITETSGGADEKEKKSVVASKSPDLSSSKPPPSNVDRFGKFALDNRSKTLLVKGFNKETKKSVENEAKAHFSKFGEINNFVFNQDDFTAIVTYSNRHAAEMAFLRGKLFQDKDLTLAWKNA